MKIYVLVVVLAAVALYFLFNNLNEGSPRVVHVEPPTAEQQFDALFNSEPVDAAKLAALCEAHPAAATRYLRNRSFRLSGVAARFLLSGLSQNRAEIFLQSDTKIKLILIYDLTRAPKYNPQNLERYSVAGAELSRVSPSGSERTPVSLLGTTIQETVTTTAIGPSTISFAAPPK